MIQYTWKEFERDVGLIVYYIRDSRKKYTSVYTFSRGGLPLGVCLSHALSVRLLIHGRDPIEAGSLVVDEIADRGTTLRPFVKQHDVIVIHKHLGSTVTPLFWLHEVTDWLHYPWELSVE
jgi:hypoxanthine phosphoribosyltransferase